MKATKERISRTLLMMPVVVVSIGVGERSACAANPGHSAGVANPGGSSLAAARRLSQPGIEDKALAAETGAWNVVSTLQFTPDAAPIVSKDLIAERRMVGNYQQEIMKPAKGSGVPDFRRIAYLHYFRVEGCWQYVSIDTRFPVGIMPARTCEKERDGKLTLEFQSLPIVGLGANVEGRTVNSSLEIEHDGPDHEFIRQYWTSADGTGRRWLAVQYEYARRH
jgi:hypothetical protein